MPNIMQTPRNPPAIMLPTHSSTTFTTSETELWYGSLPSHLSLSLLLRRLSLSLQLLRLSGSLSLQLLGLACSLALELLCLGLGFLCVGSDGFGCGVFCFDCENLSVFIAHLNWSVGAKRTALVDALHELV